MSMKQLNDTMTPELREQLRAFWAAQDATGTTYAPPPVNPSLASQEPSLGHYPADLFMSADQDGPHWDEPTQTALDFPCDGGERQLAPIWGFLCLVILAGAVVTVVLAFVTLVMPWLGSCYVRVGVC